MHRKTNLTHSIVVFLFSITCASVHRKTNQMYSIVIFLFSITARKCILVLLTCSSSSLVDYLQLYLALMHDLCIHEELSEKGYVIKALCFMWHIIQNFLKGQWKVVETEQRRCRHHQVINHPCLWKQLAKLLHSTEWYTSCYLCQWTLVKTLHLSSLTF